MTSSSNKEIVQANDIVKMAKEIQIGTHGDAEYAAEFLSKANRALDFLEEKETERTKRLKEELAYIKESYIEPKKALKAIIADLREKLSTYQTQGAILAAKEADLIAAKALSGRLSPEKAVQKLDEIDAPVKKIVVDSGKLSFIAKQTLDIQSFDAIPRSYLIPFDELILKDLKVGIKVPGCAIKIVQVPINRRN